MWNCPKCGELFATRVVTCSTCGARSDEVDSSEFHPAKDDAPGPEPEVDSRAESSMECGVYLGMAGFSSVDSGDREIPPWSSPPMHDAHATREVHVPREQQAPHEQQGASEGLLQGVHAAAENQEVDGASVAQDQMWFVVNGTDAVVEKTHGEMSANVVYSHHLRRRAEDTNSAGRMNMLFGAMWCLGGIAITAISFNAAASGGGGTYLVAWGAILFGAIQFIRGLSQLDSE